MSEYTYTYGFFWENGERATLPAPFGPSTENRENIIYGDLNNPWMVKLLEHYPQLDAEALNNPLGEDWGDWFCIVNDPETNKMLAENPVD